MTLHIQQRHQQRDTKFRRAGLVCALCVLIPNVLVLMALALDNQAQTSPHIETEHSNIDPLDQAVCWLEKPFINLYQAAIANPEAQADFSLPGLEADSFLSQDGHIIRGLVWRAEKPQGYLLIALGTSMLAEEIYPAFADLRNLNLDVFMYNYRGFKQSEGKTTLTGILADMETAVVRLNDDPRYRYRFFYGLSFGGIVFSSILNRHALPYDGVILDSVPDRLPFLLFCPDRFDPVVNLPRECAKWQAIAGGRDSVIGARGLRLAEAIEHCGGAAITPDDFGHVFMDGPAQTRQRLAFLKTYLENQMQERRAINPQETRPDINLKHAP